MQRRQFLKQTFTAGLGWTVLSQFPVSCSQKKQPNIIFIMADDLGYGALGCFGQKVIQTPFINQMAKEGLRFTQCYAGSTVCAPSRSVLMTGLHTGHTTVRGNTGKHGVKGLGGKNGRVPLKKNDVTVAEILKKAGYVTGMTGKWGLGEPNTTGEPNEKGFDEWFGYLNQRRAHSYYPEFIWKNKEKVELPGNLQDKKETYTHHLFTEFALDFVERHQNEPFFLYLPYTIPHAKYEIPELEPYVDESWTVDEKVHASMVTRMDRDVGKLFYLLKELGIDNNTIVFFGSDNGAAERWEGRFDSSGVLRGHKRDMYEGGIRTPMIVRWPGKIAGDKKSDAVWYFADVLPTFADIAGVKSPANIDGESVLSILLGKKQQLGERFLYWEFFEKGFKQAVRWKDWKAVRHGLNANLELYDLAHDVGETINVADENPAVIKKIEQYLKTARIESENWPVVKE